MSTSVRVEHNFVSDIKPTMELIHIPSTFMGREKIRAMHWEPVIIELTETLDSDVALEVIKKIHEAQDLKQPFVPLFIHSPGGDVYALFMIINAIKNAKVPIYTIVTGLAASAAACLFTCGQRRFMGPYARLMIHDVSINFGDESVTSSDARVEAKEMRKMNRTIFEIMSLNCGHDKDYLKHMVENKRNRDIYFNAEEALELNLCTDLGVPRLCVNISFDMECKVSRNSHKAVNGAKKRKAEDHVSDQVASDQESLTGPDDDEIVDEDSR